MQPTIELAKSSNTLNKLTFVLLYATDFADRLEKEIIPALEGRASSSFRIATSSRRWRGPACAASTGSGCAACTASRIAPHMVFYLNIDVKTLIGRVLESRGMDFWESGMDLKHGDDIYDSFRTYQNKLLQRCALDGRRVPLPRRRRPPLGRPHPGRAAHGRWRRSSNRSSARTGSSPSSEG